MCIYNLQQFRCGAISRRYVFDCSIPYHCLPHILAIQPRNEACRMCAMYGIPIPTPEILPRLPVPNAAIPAFMYHFNVRGNSSFSMCGGPEQHAQVRERYNVDDTATLSFAEGEADVELQHPHSDHFTDDGQAALGSDDFRQSSPLRDGRRTRSADAPSNRSWPEARLSPVLEKPSICLTASAQVDVPKFHSNGAIKPPNAADSGAADVNAGPLKSALKHWPAPSGDKKQVRFSSETPTFEKPCDEYDSLAQPIQSPSSSPDMFVPSKSKFSGWYSQHGVGEEIESPHKPRLQIMDEIRSLATIADELNQCLATLHKIIHCAKGG